MMMMMTMIMIMIMIMMMMMTRVDKPGVQEVTMRKVAQAQAAHDVAAETCETAAQPIEQGSKRVSNSVRGVGSGLKVFISHCKRISGTEDKAIWIADVLDSSEAEVKAWFDRSDLGEITMDSLKQAVEESSMLITILDPSTFDSEWVQAENAWALAAGLPILAFYDADRYRWDEVYNADFPHVFTRQAPSCSALELATN